MMPPFVAEASFSVNNLTIVNKGNETQCVQYYVYKDMLYCDATLTHSNTINPQIKNEEKLKIVFDERPWQLAWGNKNSVGTTIEYVPAGDDINNWKELVTSQFFPGLQEKITLKEFADTLILNMKSLGFSPNVTYHVNTEDRILLEIRIEEPQTQAQDELELLIKDDQGIYLLHYVIKKADMGKANRDKWLQNLQKSQRLNIN